MKTNTLRSMLLGMLLLVEGKKKVVVISSDHTRPVPSRLLMPRILREISDVDGAQLQQIAFCCAPYNAFT